jgi:hypothetical protein
MPEVAVLPFRLRADMDTLIQNMQPNLIVADLDHPELGDYPQDGHAVTRLPLLTLSCGDGYPESWCQPDGLRGHMNKPICQMAFIEMVRNLLRRVYRHSHNDKPPP